MPKETDDFFEEAPPQAPEEVKEPEKIKLSSGEFTQEELDKYVQLGKIGDEVETKWNRSIKTMYPDYQRTIKENERLQKMLEEAESKAKPVTSPTGELTDEQLKQQALEQARGLGLVDRETARREALEVFEGAKLLEKVEKLVKTTASEGKPQTTTEDLLLFMNQNGIKNEEIAYEIMNRDELKVWEKNQIEKIKPTPMVTTPGSTAGGKQPEPVKVTKNNLQEFIRAHFNKAGQ